MSQEINKGGVNSMDNIINDSDVSNAWNKVLLARNITRFRSMDIIKNVFDYFIELHGDRLNGDDKSIVGGIGILSNQAVTIIGQQKGNTQKEMENRQYGMSKPEGYRKSLRLMKQAEKFRRPIICLIDTPGAFPGVSAEEHGQAEAIARNLYEMSNFTVPIISLIVGEGGSGGALALGIANRVIMMENAIYSVVSPEGCATILFKDSRKAPEVACNLKITSKDLKSFGIIDEVISEHSTDEEIYLNIKKSIENEIIRCSQMSGQEIKNERIERYRNVGSDLVFY